MLSVQDRNNPRNRQDEDFDKKALVYFRMRLRDLDEDLRASKSGYEAGELERDVYSGVCRSIEQAMQEVRAAIANITER
jgi:hypothetical protein